MALASPTTSHNAFERIVFSAYQNFNYTASTPSSSPLSDETVLKLFNLKWEIESNLSRCKKLPNSWSAETLKTELQKRLINLFKDHKEQAPSSSSRSFSSSSTCSSSRSSSSSSSSSSTSSSSMSSSRASGVLSRTYTIEDVEGVGFRRRGSNCWANSLLQICMASPHLLEALQTVGDFYEEGDRVRMHRTIHHFQGVPLSESIIDQGLQLFDCIESPYFKLQVLYAFIQQKNKILIERLTNRLSTDDKTFLAKQSDFQLAVETLLNKKDAELSKQKDLQSAGKALKRAIYEYNRCLKERTSVPDYVSQDVRLAFHYLFGRKNPITGMEHFSSSQHANEDAHEALQCLTGRYQIIMSMKTHKTPPGYSPIEITREYNEPIAGSLDDPEKGKGYSVFTKERSSSEIIYDNQIFLQPVDKQDTPLETLLSTYFNTPAAPGTYLSTYQDPTTKKIQSYPLLRVIRQFIDTPPKALTLVIERFGKKPNGTLYKIQDRVMANRVITLPKEATTKRKSLAYELRSCILHIGDLDTGHYISYRKIGEDWVEFNDHRVRLLTLAEIDRILHGKSGVNATPYVLNYELVDDTRQEEMLKLSEELRKPTAPPPSPAKNEISKHEELIRHLTDLDVILKNPSDKNYETDIARMINNINKCSPKSFKNLCAIIAIEKGIIGPIEKLIKSGNKTLESNPSILASIKNSWIRTSSGNLISQMLQREKERLEITRCNVRCSELQKTSSMKPITGDSSSELSKNEKEFTKLCDVYIQNSLTTYLGLLKNSSIKKEQLVEAFNILDIPNETRNSLNLRIWVSLGSPREHPNTVAKAYLNADPRILLMTSDKIQPKQKKDEDLRTLLVAPPKTKEESSSTSDLFAGLTICEPKPKDTTPSECLSIIEREINFLKERSP